MAELMKQHRNEHDRHPFNQQPQTRTSAIPQKKCEDKEGRFNLGGDPEDFQFSFTQVRRKPGITSSLRSASDLFHSSVTFCRNSVAMRSKPARGKVGSNARLSRDATLVHDQLSKWATVCRTLVSREPELFSSPPLVGIFPSDPMIGIDSLLNQIFSKPRSH
jgi:hypothetical protein